MEFNFAPDAASPAGACAEAVPVAIAPANNREAVAIPDFACRFIVLVSAVKSVNAVVFVMFLSAIIIPENPLSLPRSTRSQIMDNP